MKFKSEFSLDERSMESSRMLSKHTDRVPVICEKAERSKTAVKTILFLVFNFNWFSFPVGTDLLGHWQEQISRTLRSYMWTICIRNSKASQVACGTSNSLICQWEDSSHWFACQCSVCRKQGWRRLPVHDILWRKHLWMKWVAPWTDVYDAELCNQVVHMAWTHTCSSLIIHTSALINLHSLSLLFLFKRTK